MSRMRRSLVVLAGVLLVAGVFAFPVFAQTEVENNSPYGSPEEPEEPEAPDEEDVEVGSGVEEADDDVDAAPEPVSITPAADTTEVLGVTLQRTGANALLIGTVGLLALGLGGFLVLRSRRSAVGS